MKLYFSPGACCMSCHIILEEIKTPFELVCVGRNADEVIRAEFLKLNPLGAVPTLELTDGRILTQNIAIMEYLADQHPEAKLLDKAGTFGRAEIMRWLSFAASDFHKAFTPLFRINIISENPETQKDIKNWCFGLLEKYFSILESHLAHRTYLSGERFTIADAYLFTTLQWPKAIKFSTEKYPAVNKYAENIAKRPAVIAVLTREAPFKN